MNLLCMVLLLQPAGAQEAPAATPAGVESPEGTDSWEQVLNSAIKSYLEGDLIEAAARLEAALNSGADLPPADQLKAQSYLAEVQYFQGNRQGAWATMMGIVEQDPAFRLDPFIHPPEIVSYFDSVRAAAQRLVTPQARPEAPTPITWLTAMLPGGWQIHNDQPLFAATTVAGVTGLSIATILLYNKVDGMDQEPGRSGVQVYQESNRSTAEQLKTWTNVTRFTAAGVWAGAALQGWVRSTTTPTTRASLSVTPRQASLHIILHK